MRGQSEVIATAILVSVAIVVAFGLIYYLEPQVARLSAENQVAVRLSSYSAALQLSPLSSLNTSNGVTWVFLLSNVGTEAFRIYLSILPVLNDVPTSVAYNFTVYNLTNSSALVEPGSVSGWSILPSLNVSPLRLHIFVNGKYYRLSELGFNESITIYDFGILVPGAPFAVKVDVNVTMPSVSYVFVVLTRISNDYYEIGRFVVYSPS